MNRRDFLLGTWAILLSVEVGAAPWPRPALDDMSAGLFRWTLGPPLLSPAIRPHDPCYSVKDPSVVRYNDRWHLFCTIRSQIRSHQIEYLSFEDFQDAQAAERHVLRLSDGYAATPQIFYFAPQQRWYLIYQIVDHARKPELQPAYSTTRDITDPTSWTKPTLLFTRPPDNVTVWIDFWVICDASRAHLFFTSLDGQMWRAETPLSDFPSGWSQPKVVLRDDIYEASHTYGLKGQEKFLTVVEARGSDSLDKVLTPQGPQVDVRRYYKAYVADRLEAAWVPLATTVDSPFASPVNVRETGPRWTDSFSHGELLRAGYDEHLEVDPAQFRFLFQGVSAQDMSGKSYREIPWQLGMLEAIQ
jgi:Glycosyl hydrolase family 62